MKRIAAILACLIACGTFCGCGDHGSQLPTATVHIGNHPFTLEIASSNKDQETGLMHRDSMPEDHGMIFPYNTMQERYFYNANVRFDLDLLFLDDTGTIVSIKHLEAYHDKTVASEAPAMYVIELNSGVPDKLGVKVGNRVDLPSDLAKSQVIP